MGKKDDEKRIAELERTLKVISVWAAVEYEQCNNQNSRYTFRLIERTCDEALKNKS